jgi:hypothetical protein
VAIDSAGVVPGDVLVLTPGTQAATDAKLITSSRSSNEPLSSLGPFSNRALNIMVMSVAAFLAIALGVPAVGSYFKLTPSRCPGWPRRRLRLHRDLLAGDRQGLAFLRPQKNKDGTLKCSSNIAICEMLYIGRYTLNTMDLTPSR